jgi:hypothetical protein
MSAKDGLIHAFGTSEEGCDGLSHVKSQMRWALVVNSVD